MSLLTIILQWIFATGLWRYLLWLPGSFVALPEASRELLLRELNKLDQMKQEMRLQGFWQRVPDDTEASHLHLYKRYVFLGRPFRESLLKDEIARIQQSVTAVCSDFEEHKRASTAIHNKLQAQVWTVEEAKKQEAAGSPSHVSQKSYQPLVTMTASQGSLMHPGTGSVQVPQPMLHGHGTSPRRSPSLPQPISPQSMSGPVVIPGQFHQVPNTVRPCCCVVMVRIGPDG
eukprot:s224_g15.t1